MEAVRHHVCCGWHTGNRCVEGRSCGSPCGLSCPAAVCVVVLRVPVVDAAPAARCSIHVVVVIAAMSAPSVFLPSMVEQRFGYSPQSAGTRFMLAPAKLAPSCL